MPSLASSFCPHFYNNALTEYVSGKFTENVKVRIVHNYVYYIIFKYYTVLVRFDVMGLCWKADNCVVF